MKFLLLIYTDDTLLEALPAGAFDQMMHGCITHADELKAQGTLERLELTLDAMGTNPGRDEVTQSAKAQAVVDKYTVRTETSSASASACALMRPWVSSSI